MKIKQFSERIVVGVALSVTLGSVMAGETVEHFDDAAPKFNVGNSAAITLRWADSEGHALRPKQEMLVEQTIESGYQLMRDSQVSVEQLKYNLPIESGGDSGNVTVNPSLCDLSGTKQACSFNLTADLQTTPGDDARRIRHDAEPGNTSFANGGNNNIRILEHIESGHIIATGPSEATNNISLVITSRNNSQDNVPVTIKLIDSANIAEANLQITPQNKFDQGIVAIDKSSCDLDLSSGTADCTVLASPVARGIAHYVISGTWKSRSGATGNLTPTTVELDVAALYAGYQNNKVQSYQGMDTLSDNYGISAMTFDGVHDMLYAGDGYHVYKKDLESGSAFVSLERMPDQLNSALSLTNNSTRFMVGDGGGNVTYYNSLDGTVVNKSSADNSIISTSIDVTRNNTVFVTDAVSNVYTSFVDPATKKGSLTLMDSLPDDYAVQVVGSRDGIFAVGNSYDESYISDVYIWNSNKFIPVATDNPSPFESGELIASIFTPQDNYGVYLSGRNGHLYRLGYEKSGADKMHWTALNNGQPIADASFMDGAVDDNGNIYLAVVQGGINSGVWKVPYDGSQAVRITGFDEDKVDVNALVIAKPGTNTPPPPPSAPVAYIMWLTNTEVNGGFDIYNADSICRNDVNLPKDMGAVAETTKAYLDDHEINYIADLPVYNISKDLVGYIQSSHDLPWTLKTPISKNSFKVWTGYSGGNCYNWSSSGGAGAWGGMGYSNVTDRSWYGWSNTYNCNAKLHLYCMSELSTIPTKK